MSGQGRGRDVVDVVGDLFYRPHRLDTIRPTIQQLVEAPSAGLALVLGVLTALWSASGYVGAFGRAMNRVYEQEEGRPVWKLRPLQVVLTLAGLIMAAAVAFMLAVSGPVARAVGDAIGAGSVALTIWSIAKWPVILLLVVVSVAILTTPPPAEARPRFRWMSVGASL
jgi:membrane protein